MKAAILRKFGGPENFEIADMPMPEMGPDEVLIKNYAAGVHYADHRRREGISVFSKAQLPTIIGFQVAGTIEAVGANVKTLKPGTRVAAAMIAPPDRFGQKAPGGYAEYSTATPDQVIALPDHLTFEQGLQYFGNIKTAYLMYYTYRASIPSDATVLIHAGAGGVGSSLTMVAKKAGNRVISLVRQAWKGDFSRAHGADHVVVMDDNWPDKVLELTGGEGVDASFNTLAGDTVARDIGLLKHRGLLLFVSTMKGWPTTLSAETISKAVWNNLTLQFTRTADISRAGPLAEKANAFRNEFWTKEAATLQTPTAVFPLEDVTKAHIAMEEGTAVGKIILKL